jgi:hypothetical protein
MYDPTAINPIRQTASETYSARLKFSFALRKRILTVSLTPLRQMAKPKINKDEENNSQ